MIVIYIIVVILLVSAGSDEIVIAISSLLLLYNIALPFVVIFLPSILLLFFSLFRLGEVGVGAEYSALLVLQQQLKMDQPVLRSTVIFSSASSSFFFCSLFTDSRPALNLFFGNQIVAECGWLNHQKTRGTSRKQKRHQKKMSPNLF